MTRPHTGTGMEPRVPATAWDDATGRAPHDLDPSTIGRLVVVSAHPDDETLGAAGLLHAVARAGGTIEVVLVTDGEAALPEVRSMDRDALRRKRNDELHAALAELGADAQVHRLGLPDSRLDGIDLVPELAPLLAGLDGDGAWISPWRGDPHPDHAAVGRACVRAGPVTARGYGHPIWARTRIDPEDPSVPWGHGHRLTLSADARRAKRRAIAAHASQTTVPPGGERPVLSAATRQHFDGRSELWFREPPPDGAPASLFDRLYAGGADPWRVRDSWYERRKRDVLLACLPRREYRLAAEPACGLGELTRPLAARCRRLVAGDVVADAVAATSRAVARRPWVTVLRAELDDPRSLPPGTDLVVLSEILYYLTPGRVDAVLDRVARTLEPDGDLVVAHWRGWPAEAPSDAAAVHRLLSGDSRFTPIVEHTDEHFLLHVLRRR